MYLTTFQKHNVSRRRFFDPSNKEDLKELKFFIARTKWKNGCPFFLEEPFIDIPAMCENKFTRYMLAKVK